MNLDRSEWPEDTERCRWLWTAAACLLVGAGAAFLMVVVVLG